MTSVIASLGSGVHQARRRAEAIEASARAGFVPIFLDPPVPLGLSADLTHSATRVAAEVAALVEAHHASVVVSPSPHDVHPSHETVGRGVQRALADLPDTVRWWMWGIWGDLPRPNVFYAFDEPILERAVHVLDAYGGEVARIDYPRYLRARAIATVVTGSERVFGFGSPSASGLPYAEVVTEVRRVGGRFMASEPHALDEGPEPSGAWRLDLTAWLEAPSVREILGPIRER